MKSLMTGLLLSLALTPAFAQSEVKPAATTTDAKAAPAAEIRPVSAPAPATNPAIGPPANSQSFQGFGLIQNGNAMLGIRPRQ